MYLLASNASWGMFGAGVLMLIFLLLRRSKRYLGKAKKEHSTRRRKLDNARHDTPLLDAPPEILRWQVEMHDAARDLKAELDSKMGTLQAIIRIASEESTRLETAIARAEQLGVSPCADTLAAIEELSDNSTSVGDALSGMLSTTTDKAAARRNTIYQLADQGLAAGAIAQSIGAPLGEVELLMRLRSEPT